MRLLTAPFDPSARVPSALVRPLLEVGLIAAGSIALLLAADTLAGEWRGLGRAAASGGSHAAMIAAGLVIALGGAPRWRMPAAASAAALIVASVAARLVPAGAVLYLPILGLASCALRAWSGSVLPGYLATLAFFAAYRALDV